MENIFTTIWHFI